MVKSTIMTVLVGVGIVTSLAAGQTGNVLIDDSTAADVDIKPSDVIHWEPIDATQDQNGRVEVNLRLRTEQEFTLYNNKVSFTPPPGYSLEAMTSPPTRSLVDPVMDKTVDVYYGGEFKLVFAGPKGEPINRFPLTVGYLGCTSRICLFPYKEIIELPVTAIAGMPEGDTPPDPTEDKKHAENSIATGHVTLPNLSAAPPTLNEAPPDTDEDLESTLATQMKDEALPFTILLLIAFIGGVLTNITPCVYPMIPITIRVLGRQGKSPLLASSAYAGGILVTYTSLGLFAASSGTLFGSIMASPTFGIAFAAMMFILGLTMLGFGNFSALQNLGNRLGSGRASIKNAFLMGTSAGLVASPCTGPVLALILAYIAREADMSKGVSLLFIYSFGFALPYVFLGGAVARVAKIRVSPQAQVAVKAAFASVMFALGFYYLRIPAHDWLKGLSGQWPMITMVGIAVGVLTAAALYVIPQAISNKGALILPSIVLGLGIFGGYQWISGTTTDLVWYHNEEEALRVAKERNLPVLIDAWAEWCEACKKMDATTFSDPSVAAYLRPDQWVLLKLDFTESTEATKLLEEKYEIQSLPTLTILKAGGRIEDRQAILGYIAASPLINRLRILEKE